MPKGRPPKAQPQPAQANPQPTATAQSQSSTELDPAKDLEIVSKEALAKAQAAQPKPESPEEKAKKAEDARVQKFYYDIMVRIPLEHISGKVEILKGQGVMYITISNKLNLFTRVLEINDADIAQFKADIATKL